MPSPAITVLMPVYNAAAYLTAAIESVLGQTERDFELLAVDDGSIDGSAALLASWAARDPRVRVLTLPHGGIVKALNHGLAHARGRYIARMDADDLALPERLARQKAWLDARSELGLVGCGVAHETLGPARETTGYALYVDWLNRLTTPEAIATQRFAESPLAHPSVMFRHALVAQFGGYREGPFPEDYELWLRWLEAGVQMAKVPETLLVWRDPPERLSRTHPAYDVEAFYALKAEYLARHLARINPAHPEVVIWGAGKTSRRRAGLLEGVGLRIRTWVDIDPRREGRVARGRPIVAPAAILGPEFGFVLAYVSKRGASDYIRGQLVARGFEEGRHFLIAA